MAGVVAADLVELGRQSGVVTGVAEQDGSYLSARGSHSKHRHAVVNRTLRIDPQFDASSCHLAAVRRKTGCCLAELDHGRLQIAEAPAHDLNQLLEEQLAVVVGCLGVGGVEVVHRLQVLRARSGRCGCGRKLKTMCARSSL